MNHILYDYNNFNRLHPLTWVYNFFKNLPYFAITLYLGLYQNQREELIYILITIILGIFIIPGNILKWYYFTFMISENEIILKSGVLSRKQRNIPIERIQNVNVKQDILQRILGIAKVEIETAGDIHTEAALEFVKLKEADEINRIIRLYQKNLSKNEQIQNQEISQNFEEIKSETFQTSDKSNIIFELSNKDLILFGMIRLRPLFLVYGIWAMSFLSQFQNLFMQLSNYLESTVNNFSHIPIYYLIGLFLVFLLFSFIISWLIDILWTFAQFYGFKLMKDGNKLFSSYGLLSKYSVTIPLKKLQQISIQTNPIKKKLDFYSMTLYTAGYDLTYNKSPIAIPLAKMELLKKTSQDIFPIDIPKDFERISEKSIRRIFIRLLIQFTPFVLLSYFFINFYVLFFLALMPLFYYIAYLRWKNRSYSIQSDIIFIKQGIWYQKINIIPIKKIQTLHISETFFQRRLFLSTIHIDTAASQNISDALIPDIDSETAKIILKNINDKFKSSNKLRFN